MKNNENKNGMFFGHHKIISAECRKKHENQFPVKMRIIIIVYKSTNSWIIKSHKIGRLRLDKRLGKNFLS
jgi:hypothetical protein